MIEGIDWLGWFKTISGAGIGTIIVQPLVSYFNDRRTRNRQASYLALRLAVILEAYASACSDLLEKNQNAQWRPDEQFPDWDLRIPEVPEFPDEAEGWRSLELDLAQRALSLKNIRHFSQGSVHAILEFQDADDAIKEITHFTAEIGLESWNIADSLRQKYGINPPKIVYDFTENLKSNIKNIENRSE